MTDTGLSILRLVVGLLMAGHCAQKLFGMFGDHGLKGTSGWLGSVGGRCWQVSASSAACWLRWAC